MNDIRRTIESVEIEDAYQLLKKLMDQMQRLKISLYEQELEKKQIELDFRKIQIKPQDVYKRQGLLGGWRADYPSS